MPEDNKKLTQQADTATAEANIFRISDIARLEPDIAKRCYRINWNVGYFVNPEDTVIAHIDGLPDGVYEDWARKRYDLLISVVAKATGADPEQLADPKQRTPEQEKAILQYRANEWAARLSKFRRSNYTAAVKLLHDHCIALVEAGQPDTYREAREADPLDDTQENDVLNVPLAAILYFFATHDEIDPLQAYSMTDENKTEIIDIFTQLDKLYMASRDTVVNEYSLLSTFADIFHGKKIDRKSALQVSKAEDFDWTLCFLDKVNASLWDGTTFKDNEPVGVHTGADGKLEPVIPVTVDFGQLEAVMQRYNVKLTKELTQTEKQYFTAIASLFEYYRSKGETRYCFTLTDICKRAGYTGQRLPLEEAKRCLLTISGTWMNISNQSEIDAGYHYPLFRYYGSILPLEMITGEINGGLTECLVHLFREPPLLTFSRDRKQITKFPRLMLESKVRRETLTLTIRDYLQIRIARWRRDRDKAEKALAGLQRKNPNKLTDEETKRIVSLQKALKKPLKILYTTMFDKLPCPAATLTEQEAKELDPKQQEARINQRQQQSIRQRNKRAKEYAERYLDDWAHAGIIGAYKAGDKSFTISYK